AIAEQSFAFRNVLPQIHRLENDSDARHKRIEEELRQAAVNLPGSAVLAIERLASARTRLLEAAPQTRREAHLRWLHKVVQPGRVAAVGRSGKRLVLVTARSHDGVTALREDGRTASFALERIGRVFAPIFSTKPERVEEAV